jgi:hypothetical protein
MGQMLPKPADLGNVDLAFMVFHGKRVVLPGTGYQGYMVEVTQEALTFPDQHGSTNPLTTGTLLYIYNVPPKEIPSLKEAK